MSLFCDMNIMAYFCWVQLLEFLLCYIDAILMILFYL